MTNLPTLVVISGPGGSGKTTLAHSIARAIGCPAICRDEIKEGMAHATPGFVPGPSDGLTKRTLPTFFGVLDTLLRAGVTTVAEAAFQDHLWRPNLEPLRPLAHIRVVHCVVDPHTAFTRTLLRWNQNPLRRAHADNPSQNPTAHAETHNTFARLSINTPSLEVDTTNGYTPALPEIITFINHPT